jgi:predicted lipid-binding transport protein (Tim44 family)
MAEREPQWAEENLLAIARDKFILLQTAWGNQDLQLLKKELHPVLYPNWESQIKDQMARGEKNVMNGLSIESMKIVDVKNFTDDEKDEFTVCFDARANDQTISHGVVTKTDNSSFREFWTFEWEKGQWALREVTQRSGWRRFVSAAIIDQSKLGKK